MNLATVSLCLVIRSSSWISLPLLLLVKGDVIKLGFGDKAPCSVEYISPFPLSPGAGGDNGAAQSAPRRLSKGQLFRPDSFVSSPSVLDNKGSYYFKLLESPVIHALQASLTSARPETVIHSQLKILQRLFSTFVVPLVLLCALLINIPRFVLLKKGGLTQSQLVKLGMEMLIHLSLYVLLPVLPLALPTFFVIARAFGNAQILALYEALQSSQVEEFEDKDDVDEFGASIAVLLKKNV